MSELSGNRVNYRYLLLLLTQLVCLLFQTVSAQPFSAAQQAFQQGNYEQAIVQWQTALTTTQKVSNRFETWLGMVRAYRYLGAYDQAAVLLNTALSHFQTQDNLDYHALLLSELSKLRFSQGEQWRDVAVQKAIDALNQARAANNPRVLVEVLNHWGNLLTAEYDYEGALTAYREALTHLDTQPLPETAAIRGKILINQLKATFLLESEQAYQYEDKQSAFTSSLTAVTAALQYNKNNKLNNYDKALGFIHLSQLAQAIQTQLTSPLTQLTDITYQALLAARQIAEHLNHSTAKAYVYGYLGQWYEQRHRYADALSLTRQALFFAQQTREQPLLYYWYWQLGRLLNTQGDKNGAIKAYQQAVTLLNPIRRQVATTGYVNITADFREQIAPVYFELADLLLQATRSASTPQREQWLRQARETIEFFKTAELQDYFHWSCVDTQTQCIDIEHILDAHTAVLYPIPLPNRLELLLNLPSGLIQATVPITETDLQDKVGAFLSPLHRHPHLYDVERSPSVTQPPDAVICTPASRGNTSQPLKATAQAFLSPAQTLYQWLIEPLSAHLSEHQIKTLVIVPDGVLRTIPFSALHDGQQFLIQKYALAVAPSLCLSEPQTLRPNQYTLLLGGVSKAVQGFSSLPCAEYELKMLEKLFDMERQSLLNEQFTLPQLHTNLNQQAYSIVHIASHGQFSAQLDNTFILTYDAKLSLDRLEQLMNLTTFQNKPVDLLTLSACETAVGNDRAALGLAGVALKAGVKSALASLWQVDDEATPAVVIEFYRQLQNPTLSKAQALQNAQNLILTDKNYVRYRHPYYWSAFLLIGNWL